MTGSPNRLLGRVFGVVYLLVGLVGFAVTSGVDLAATDGEPLVIFDVNPLHNIVHLLVGAVLLAAALQSATLANWRRRHAGQGCAGHDFGVNARAAPPWPGGAARGRCDC